LATARFREGPRVALLQSDFIQQLKLHLDARQIVAIYHALIGRALTEKPDLIVWPETSYPHGYPVFDSELDDVVLLRQIKALNPRGTLAFWKEEKVEYVRLDLQGVVNAIETPMLVGTITYEFRPYGLSRYNSAVLFMPKRETVSSYHKLHLVPFGEYVPLIKTFPALLRLTPFQNRESIPSLAFGPSPAWFRLKDLRFATAICFEDTVPHVVRRFFKEAPADAKPDFLVNISNDGWFRGSSEIDMHLAISAFRAVEHRVPLARAVNTGGSAIIDGNGSILKSLPKEHEDVLIGTLPLDGRASFYTATGDWLPFTALALTVGLVAIAAVWHKPDREPASEAA
jgi:apolipoprotein N-acyltransferase